MDRVICAQTALDVCLRARRNAGTTEDRRTSPEGVSRYSTHCGAKHRGLNSGFEKAVQTPEMKKNTAGQGHQRLDFWILAATS